METTVEKLKSSRIVTTTKVSENEKNDAEKKALERLAHHVKIKGFRPGKAPSDLVREQIRDEALLDETVQVLLPMILKNALDESKAKPILRPAASVTSVDPLTVTLTFIERPTVTLKKPQSITVEKKKLEEVTAAEIDSFVQKVMAQDRTETPVDRAAAKGDAVRLSLKATDSDGKPVEELTVGHYGITLGSEELLKELEPHVMGMKKDDIKTTDITFPKEHDIPALRGKKVKVEMTAKTVSSVTVPELTAEYLKTRLGADRSLEQFRADIKDMLTRQRTEAETKRREEELYDKVRSATSVELAPELIDTEVQEMVRDFVGRLKEQGSTFADWLTATNKKEEDVVKEMKEIAQSRIILRFGMQELANALEIEPAEDAMKAQLDSARASAKAEGHPLPEEELKSGGGVYEQVRWEQRMQGILKKMIG